MSLITAPEDGGRFALHLNRSISLVSAISMTLSGLSLTVMVVIVAVEIVLRTGFSTSTYLSDEYAGYALVVLSLCSLAICHLNGRFPRVEAIIGNLPKRFAQYVEILFDVVALALVALLLWKLTEFELASIRSGDVAPTLTATPLWIPKMALVIGPALYLVAVCQVLIVHIMQLRHPDAQSPA